MSDSSRHDPNEAIRISDREPVAIDAYKTQDPAWFAPNIPKADKAIRIKFKKMSETAKIPTAIRDGDIGFDLYSDESFLMNPGTVKKVLTNIQLADMPTTDFERNRIFMKVEGRSGLSAKGIFPTGGIIDPTYRGEISIVLNMVSNPGQEERMGVKFNKGDRIAQLVIYKVATAGEVTMEETDKVTETNRGSSGFGSSGL
jgi:dUTP pyrophosphatase